jgi:hypothetical protein
LIRCTKLTALEGLGDDLAKSDWVALGVEEEEGVEEG